MYGANLDCVVWNLKIKSKNDNGNKASGWDGFFFQGVFFLLCVSFFITGMKNDK